MAAQSESRNKQVNPDLFTDYFTEAGYEVNQ
jgi:hypothetical protein